MSTIQLFVEGLPSKAQQQDRLEKIQRELSVLLVDQKKLAEEIYGLKKTFKEKQAEHKNALDHSYDSKATSALEKQVDEIRDSILICESQSKSLSHKKYLFEVELTELKSSIEGNPVADVKKALFSAFDQYNKSAEKLAETISKIRALEMEFRKLGGPYEFLSKYLGTGKPLGCWSAIPRLVPERIAGEATCFFLAEGVDCEKTISAKRRR
jgi:hypothetical protein